MYSVSHSQLLVPQILFNVHHFLFLRPSCQSCPSLLRRLYVRFDFSCLGVRFPMMIACHRWEFVSTLGFEWEVFTGRRPWKWSFAVYLLARFMAIVSVILNLIGSSIHTEYNCTVSGRSLAGVTSVHVLTS